MSWYRVYEIDILRVGQLYLQQGVDSLYPAVGTVLTSDGSGGTVWLPVGGSQAALTSTILGLGNVGYISTQQLQSTVNGLGNIYLSTGGGGTGEVTAAQLTSSIGGLGTVGYISSLQLQSTLRGLQSNFYTSNINASTGYISSLTVDQLILGDGSGWVDVGVLRAQAVSTIQINSYIANLTQVNASSLKGDGSQIYNLNAISSQSLQSTVVGLGNIYLSTGGGGTGEVTSAQLQSTTRGLGTAGYISTVNFSSFSTAIGTTFFSQSTGVSSLNAPAFTGLQGTISSLQVNGLTIGTGTGWVNMGPLQAIAVSTITFTTSQGIVSSIQGDGSLLQNVAGLSTVGLYTSNTSNYYKNLLQDWSTPVSSVYYYASTLSNWTSTNLLGFSTSVSTVAQFTSNTSNYYANVVQNYSTMFSTAVSSVALFTSNTSNYYKNNLQDWSTQQNTIYQFTSNTSNYYKNVLQDWSTPISSLQAQVSSGLSSVALFTSNTSNYFANNAGGTGTSSLLGVISTGFSTLALFTSNTSNFYRNTLQDFSTPLLSTTAGLGTATYISSAQLVSSVTSIFTTYKSLSVNISTLTTSNLTGNTGYVSSLIVDSLQSDLVSTIQINTDKIFANQVSSSAFIGDGSRLTNLPAISSLSLQSTVRGLGTAGYLSTISQATLFTSNTSNYYSNLQQNWSTPISSLQAQVSSGLSSVALFTSNTSNSFFNALSYYANTIGVDVSTGLSTVALFTSNTSNYFLNNAGGTGVSSLFGVVSTGLSTTALFTSNTSNYYSNLLQNWSSPISSLQAQVSTGLSTTALFTSNTSNYYSNLLQNWSTPISSLQAQVSSGLSTIALFTSNTSNYYSNLQQNWSTSLSTVALFTSNSIASTTIGLGNIYLSSALTASLLTSTTIGLGNIYISTQSLTSTTTGLTNNLGQVYISSISYLAMNYSQRLGNKVTVTTTTTLPAPVVSTTITTQGFPVQILVTGDAENSSAGSWVRMQLYRGNTAIGNQVWSESSATSENGSFSITFIDNQPAGTYEYFMRVVAIAGGNFNFGETDGPVLTAIELNTGSGISPGQLASTVNGLGQFYVSTAASGVIASQLLSTTAGLGQTYLSSISQATLFTSNTSNYYANLLQNWSTPISTLQAQVSSGLSSVALFTSNTSNYFANNAGGAGTSSLLGVISSGFSTLALFTSNTSNYYINLLQNWSTPISSLQAQVSSGLSTTALFTSNTSNYYSNLLQNWSSPISTLQAQVSSGLSTTALFTSNTSNYYKNILQNWSTPISSLQAQVSSGLSTTALFTSNTSNYYSNLLQNWSTPISSLQAQVSSGLSSVALFTSNTSNFFANNAGGAGTSSLLGVISTGLSTVALFTSNTSNYARNILQDFSTPLLSTTAGLGTATYISSAQLVSSITSITTSYRSLSVNISTLTTSNLTGTTGFISSLQVNSLQFGDGNGWADFGAVRAVIISTIQINTDTVFANQISSSTFVGDGSQLTNLPAISSLSLQSTVRGLGTAGYLSTISQATFFTSNTSNYYSNVLQNWSTPLSTVATFTSNTSNYFLNNAGGTGVSSLFGVVSTGLSTVALFTSNTSNYTVNILQNYSTMFSTAVSTVALFTSNTSNYTVNILQNYSTMFSTAVSTVALFTSNTSNYARNILQDWSTQQNTIYQFTSNTSNYAVNILQNWSTPISSLQAQLSSGLSTVALFTSNTSNFFANNAGGAGTSSLLGVISTGLSTTALFTSNTSNYYANLLQNWSTPLSSLQAQVSTGLSTTALFTSNTSNYYANLLQNWSTPISSLQAQVSSGLSTTALFTSNTSNYYANLLQNWSTPISSLQAQVSSGLSTTALFTSNTSNWSRNLLQDWSTPMSTLQASVSTGLSTVALFTSNTSNWSRNMLQDWSTSITSTTLGLGNIYLSSFSTFTLSTGTMTTSTLGFLDINTQQTQRLYVSSGVLVLNGQGIGGGGGGNAGLTTSDYVVAGKLSGDQALTADTDNIIRYIDDYDPQNWYNSGTYRFVPTIAGYYIVTHHVWFLSTLTTNNQFNIQIRRNGDGMALNQMPQATTTGTTLEDNKIFYMNGSSDYVEFTAFVGNTSNTNYTKATQGNGSGSGTYFTAALLTNGSSGDALISTVNGLGSAGYVSTIALTQTSNYFKNLLQNWSTPDSTIALFTSNTSNYYANLLQDWSTAVSTTALFTSNTSNYYANLLQNWSTPLSSLQAQVSSGLSTTALFTSNTSNYYKNLLQDWSTSLYSTNAGLGTAGYLSTVLSASNQQVLYLSSGVLKGSSNLTYDGFQLSTYNLLVRNNFNLNGQIFYSQGADGFSVNENYDSGNTTTTAYHFTSGNSSRNIMFSIAKTSNFTNMFATYGTPTNNTFVIASETQSNTTFDIRQGVGIGTGLNLSNGGRLFLRLSNDGQLYIPLLQYASNSNILYYNAATGLVTYGGTPLVSSSLYSTVIGLGTAGYVSTIALTQTSNYFQNLLQNWSTPLSTVALFASNTSNYFLSNASGGQVLSSMLGIVSSGLSTVARFTSNTSNYYNNLLLFNASTGMSSFSTAIGTVFYSQSTAASSLNVGYITGLQGSISSLQVNALTIGTGTGWVNMGPIQAVAVSTIVFNTAQAVVSSVQGDGSLLQNVAGLSTLGLFTSNTSNWSRNVLQNYSTMFSTAVSTTALFTSNTSNYYANLLQNWSTPISTLQAQLSTGLSTTALFTSNTSNYAVNILQNWSTPISSLQAQLSSGLSSVALFTSNTSNYFANITGGVGVSSIFGQLSTGLSTVALFTSNTSNFYKNTLQDWSTSLYSTTAGLGTATYISSAQLTSSLTSILTYYKSLSVNISTLTTSNLTGITGYVSSLIVDSLQFGTGNGWIDIGPIRTVAVSTIQINVDTVYANVISSSVFAGDGSRLTNLPAISSLSLQSTVRGLGTAGYASTIYVQQTSNYFQNVLQNYSTMFSTAVSTATLFTSNTSNYYANLLQNWSTPISSLQAQLSTGLSTTALFTSNTSNYYANVLQNWSTPISTLQASLSTGLSTVALFTSNTSNYYSNLQQNWSSPIYSSLIGLGTFGYISTGQFLSSQVGMYSNISSFIDPTELTSTIIGLGAAGFISSIGLQEILNSTVTGLTSNISSMIDPNELASTVVGLGGQGLISSVQLDKYLASTTTGLGTAGYASTLYVQQTSNYFQNVLQNYSTMFSTAVSTTALFTSNTSNYYANLLQNWSTPISTLQASLSTGLSTVALFTSNTSNFYRNTLQDWSTSLLSTTAGLGSATYISSAQLVSSVASILTSYRSLSVNISTLTTSNLTGTTGFISSLQVNSLQFGDGNGWADFGAVRAVIISTLQVNTDTLFANQVSSSTFVGDGSQLTNLPAISSASLQSTVRGLGSAGYASTIYVQQTSNYFQNVLQNWSTPLSTVAAFTSNTSNYYASITGGPGLSSLAGQVSSGFSTLGLFTSNTSNYYANVLQNYSTMFSTAVSTVALFTSNTSNYYANLLQNWSTPISTLQATVSTGLSTTALFTSNTSNYYKNLLQDFSTPTSNTSNYFQNVLQNYSTMFSTAVSTVALFTSNTSNFYKNVLQDFSTGLSTVALFTSNTITSTVAGLGTASYISSLQLQSTTTGLTNYISTYIITAGNTTGEVLYLNYSQSLTSPYKALALTPTLSTLQSSVFTVLRNTSNQSVAQFKTNFTLPSFIPTGIWELAIFAKSARAVTYLYASLHLVFSDNTEQYLATAALNPILVNALNYITQYDIPFVVPYTNTSTGSLALRIYANTADNQDDTLITYYEDGEYSHLHTTFGTIIPEVILTSTVVGLGTAGYISTAQYTTLSNYYKPLLSNDYSTNLSTVALFTSNTSNYFSGLQGSTLSLSTGSVTTSTLFFKDPYATSIAMFQSSSLLFYGNVVLAGYGQLQPQFFTF